jgi:23S rRNA (guanine2535-N1)-methyltransferase
MKFRFATQRENYEDYASGRVLYGRPGQAAFPVRLASEVFQRCCHTLAQRGASPPYTLYDPCCGSGYLLTVVGLLHGAQLARILASDIDDKAVEQARENLSLLTAAGMDRRLDAIRRLFDAYGKPSHLGALESGRRLKAGLAAAHEAIATECFPFDATGDADWPGAARSIDIVLTDLPYGGLTSWRGSSAHADAARKLLTRLEAVLSPTSVVALIATRQQVASHAAYRRIESLAIGKRRIQLLERVEGGLAAARSSIGEPLSRPA